MSDRIGSRSVSCPSRFRIIGGRARMVRGRISFRIVRTISSAAIRPMPADRRRSRLTTRRRSRPRPSSSRRAPASPSGIGRSRRATQARNLLYQMHRGDNSCQDPQTQAHHRGSGSSSRTGPIGRQRRERIRLVHESADRDAHGRHSCGEIRDYRTRTTPIPLPPFT